MIPPVKANAVPEGLAPIDPRIVFPSAANAFSVTGSPFGGVGETLMVTLKFCPEVFVVLLAPDSVVVVPVRVAELHSFSRFATLTEPSPVARS